MGILKHFKHVTYCLQQPSYMPKAQGRTTCLKKQETSTNVTSSTYQKLAFYFLLVFIKSPFWCPYLLAQHNQVKFASSFLLFFITLGQALYNPKYLILFHSNHNQTLQTLKNSPKTETHLVENQSDNNEPFAFWIWMLLQTSYLISIMWKNKKTKMRNTKHEFEIWKIKWWNKNYQKYKLY